MVGIIVAIIVILLVVLVLIASIRIITQPNQGVVLTFGKFERVISSGFHFIKPFISRVITVNTAQTPLILINKSLSPKITLKSQLRFRLSTTSLILKTSFLKTKTPFVV